MIFVTVGAQMPFDRLIRAVDDWVGRTRRADVFAQIGSTGWCPTHMRWVEFLRPEEFRQRVKSAQAVVSHAGMGTILTALQYGTPLLVMPRQAELSETRNDHQLATVRRFFELERIAVALDEVELAAKLDELEQIQPGEKIGPYASPQLLTILRRFVSTEAETHGTVFARLLSPKRRGSC